MKETKSFEIPKALVMQAYKLVKANAGAAGVDQQSIKEFSNSYQKNLYKIWNRMSSGSYFPPPVKAVPIPKKTGGERILGVPTVADRIAQMVVKLAFEPKVEPHFLADSYGYRPNKSALEAVGKTRQRCWQFNWVLEFDIKGLFDHIPHELLLRAVRKHTTNKWEILYIERWLKAPMMLQDGSLRKRESGTPQGGVISPVLSNLFLHYVFDRWMQKHYPSVPWCRYADDGLLHCKSYNQAQYLLRKLKVRFNACGLQLHPDKTKIVYCKDSNRAGVYQDTMFDFLGYTFRPRKVKSHLTNKRFISFTPAVSKIAMKSMRAKVKKSRIVRRSELDIEDISKIWNPILMGWINYYGKYHISELDSVFRHFNQSLVKWAMNKYKKLKGRKRKTISFLTNLAKSEPSLFAHWSLGRSGAFT